MNLVNGFISNMGDNDNEVDIGISNYVVQQKYIYNQNKII